MKLFKFKWKTLIQDEWWVGGIYASNQGEAINLLGLDKEEMNSLRLVSVEDVFVPVVGTLEFSQSMEDYLMESYG